MGKASYGKGSLLESVRKEAVSRESCPNQIQKVSTLETGVSESSLESSMEGKSGKQKDVYVGSWDSTLGCMEYTRVEGGHMGLQLARDPKSTSYFPRVITNSTKKDQVQKKNPKLSNPISDSESLAKVHGLPQPSPKPIPSLAMQFTAQVPPSISPLDAGTSPGQRSTWKKRARSGKVRIVSLLQGPDGEGKRKSFVVAGDGGDYDTHPKKKAMATLMMASEVQAVAVD